MAYKKLKNTILTLGTLSVGVAPIAAVVSCSSLTGQFGHRVINQYGELASSVVQSQRSFDPNFNSGNKFNGKILDKAATVLPLVQTRVTGKDVPNYDKQPTANNPYNVPVTFSKTQTKKYEFQGSIGVKIDDEKKVYTDIPSIPDTATTKWKKITFMIPKNVHYVNYKNEETKYTLQAKDFLYGMIRTLYAGTELRDQGKVNGNVINGLKKFSDSDYDILEENDGDAIRAMNNPNSYLFDLFDININATIAANEAKTAKTDEFQIIFNHYKNDPSKGAGQKSSLEGFFADSATFSPQPSQKIDELANAWHTKTGKSLEDNPGIKYGISNYGYNGLHGVNLSGYKDYLSVSPYLFTKFDIMNEYEVVQNKHFLQSNWSKDPHTIKKFIYHILPAGGDPSARIMQRISNYNKGIESILDQTVYSSPQFEQFKKNPSQSGYTYHKLVETGNASSLGWDITVNPIDIKVNGQPGYNAQGYKLMYGDSDPDQIFKGGFASINQFMNGNGMKLRNVINNAFNAFTMVQESTTASNQTANRGILKPESQLWDNKHLASDYVNASALTPTGKKNLNVVFARPTGSPTEKQLEDWYQNNTNNVDLAMKSPIFNNYKAQLDQLVKQNNITSANPAQIPIAFFRYSDAKLNEQIAKVYERILNVLNQLEPGVVKFAQADTTPQNEFTLGVQTSRSVMFHYTPWGADYPLATSNYQGLYSVRMGVGSIMGLLYHDLATTAGKANPFAPDLVDAIKADKDDFPLLNGETKPGNGGSSTPIDLKSVFDKISISDIRTLVLKSNDVDKVIKDKNVRDLLWEFTTVISKPFYSISAKERAVVDLTTYYQDHAFIYPFVTSNQKMVNVTSTKRIVPTGSKIGVGAAEIVKKPWLTTAISNNGTYLLEDYRVDY